VNEYEPEVAGVPLSEPPDESDRPDGSAPCVTRTVYGGFGPATETLCEYALPAVAPASVLGEMANVVTCAAPTVSE
jgi:hypothetical protein